MGMTDMSKKCEVWSVASGKGGTGKTLILASLGYALQTAGHRVLFVDTDLATDGLSLFLLGPRGWEAIEHLSAENTFRGVIEAKKQHFGRNIRPFRVNRGRADDHGMFYSTILSGNGLYGDLSDDGEVGPEPEVSRVEYRAIVDKLFCDLRQSGDWDYVLVDTRGGFSFNTVEVCSLSDSFMIITEADFTSFYQDKNLMERIKANSHDIGVNPVLRGVVVNKATEGVSETRSEDSLPELSLDRIEASFRTVIASQFKIRYSDTHPIPIDLDAISAYKSQRIPYVAAPASIFSFATLTAFSDMLKVVTVEWPEESKAKWNALVDLVSERIDEQNKVRRDLQNSALDARRKHDELETVNRALSAELEVLRLQRDEWQRLIATNASVIAENASLLNKIKEMKRIEAEQWDLKATASASVARQQELMRRVTDLEYEKNSYLADLAGLTSKNSEIEHAADEKRKELAKLTAEIRASQAQIRNYKIRLSLASVVLFILVMVQFKEYLFQ